MKPLLACATASLAAALTACGTQTAGESSLTPLQLTDANVAAQIAGAPSGGASGFELRTTLPTETPAPAPVWRMPHSTAADAARVAAALGLPGRPTAIAGGWVLRYDGQRLAVRSDGGWFYGLDCSPNVPVGQESLDVMCASASGGGVAVAPGTPGGLRPTPPPPPSGPTDAQVRALAAPILTRLGWSDATLEVAVGSPATSVTARRAVAGIATAGWTTTLGFTGNGRLVDGNGIVGEPNQGRAYPLISAARAYQLLLAQPRPMTEVCAVRKDHKPGCAPIPPTVITAATLGLSLRHELGQPLLVPTWLFTVKGSSEPIAIIAVDPHWLRPPASVVPRPLPPQSVTPAGPVSPPGPPSAPK